MNEHVAREPTVPHEAAQPKRELTPDQWRQIRDLLATAIGLPIKERPAYVASACKGDDGLRVELESLIAAHEVAEGGKLEQLNLSTTWTPHSGVDGERGTSLIGKRVGAYRIEAEIAHGGMGRVYRATRDDDRFSKQVAVKILDQDMVSDRGLELFRHERKILANLEHPNIARLLDAGEGEDSAPYFVMEYVDGDSIDAYCDAHRLTIEQRLSLFLKVCSAVQYAHQSLVIHRDIKPANILVTHSGDPKLLDFGIAKIADENNPNITVTATAWRVMTPAYASPEQLLGKPLTIATDIYSLGLVLYELLVGRYAYGSATSAVDLQRAILERDPQRPSAAILTAPAPDDRKAATAEQISEARQLSPQKLCHALRGDLESIVLKAVRKEPQARYASVEHLSEDIERYLEGRPVRARQGTLTYRVRKFVARHRAAVVAGCLAIMLLIGGIAAILREAQIARQQQARAERRFNDVRALANSLMFEVHDSIKDLAGATPARKLLVSKALQYLDSLSREAGGDISLQRELAAAYEKVGDVQGNPFAANLGDATGALASFRKALAIRESIAASQGKSEESQRNLANDYEWIGMALQSLGDYPQALESYRKDFAIQDALSRSSPSWKSQERLAGVYWLMANCYATLQDGKSALENYRKSAAIRETIAGEAPFVRSRLAGTYSFMAGILYHQGDRNQAVQLQRRALEISKELSEASPQNATYREFLDEAYYWVGFYLEREGDFAQALVDYRRALADFQALSSTDPKDIRTKHYAAMCLKSIGTSLMAEGHITQGLESIRKALSIFEELPAPESTGDIADAYYSMGFAYSRLAAQAGTSRASRLADQRQSCAAYQSSLSNWLKVKGRGALTLYDAGEPDRMKRQLAKCESALAAK